MRLWEIARREFSPAFKRWFANSVVRHPDGTPMPMFHGTMSTFDEFFSGSHFGDKAAANARLANLSKDDDDELPRFRGHRGAVIPVYLSIQNPLRIEDDHGLTDGYDLVDAVKRAGTITAEEARQLNDTRSPGIAKRRLFELLTSKGYDGLVYHNVVEGDADSYVIFRPEQVKSVFNPTPSGSPLFTEGVAGRAGINLVGT